MFVNAGWCEAEIRKQSFHQHGPQRGRLGGARVLAILPSPCPECMQVPVKAKPKEKNDKKKDAEDDVWLFVPMGNTQVPFKASPRPDW